MVLIDSNIWIEFLKSKPNFIKEVELLLESKQVITIEPIFSELLYGTRSDKEKNIILSYWKVLPKIKFNEGSLLEAADFANKSNYHHLGIGLMHSILIKSTISSKCLIWTLDKKIIANIDKKLLYEMQTIL